MSKLKHLLVFSAALMLSVSACAVHKAAISYKHKTASKKVAKKITNINTASYADLVRLFGECPAKAILKYKEKNKFKSINELAKIQGRTDKGQPCRISKLRIEQIKNRIKV